MSEPIIQIRNHHSAACGDPPIVDSTAGNQYTGYFENAFGEQWIFTFDRESAKAVLRGGDAGWNTEMQVLDGRVAELVLSEEEELWLQSCWVAATKLGQ